MPDTRLPDILPSDDTAQLVQAARAADAMGNRICNTIGDEAPQLIERVQALRSSLKTMLAHANHAMEASQHLRMSDDMRHRDHMEKINQVDRVMCESVGEGRDPVVIPLRRPASPASAKTRAATRYPAPAA